jgi:hypothetical protein
MNWFQIANVDLILLYKYLYMFDNDIRCKGSNRGLNISEVANARLPI